MSYNKPVIPKFDFFEPIRNLHKKTPVIKETQFAVQFARAYVTQLKKIHSKSKKHSIAYAREIPINGFGIADLVMVSWNSGKLNSFQKLKSIESFIDCAKPTTRAFEIKLRNWRKCMAQANRYRYFSNTAIAVLPIDKCQAPLKHIETFKKIHVGLWGFSIKSNKITAYFTPKPAKSLNLQHYSKAIKTVNSASKSLPIV